MPNVSFANSLLLIVWQEFKFNANAKSFIPSQTPLRPSSPVADSPFYYPASMTAVTHMHGMPVGVGVNTHFFIATCFSSFLDGVEV